MLAEVVPQDKELLVKGVYRLHLVVLLDLFLPHAHEFPRLELLEEGEVLDVVVGVALNEPLTEGHEFDGRLLLVKSQALARDGVVLVQAVLVATGLEVVRIILVHASEVREDGLFLTPRVQQQLDVLVKLSPLLWLLGLLRVLIAEVVDDVGRLSVSLGLGSGAATLDEVASGALAFGPVDGRQGSWWQLAGELV